MMSDDLDAQFAIILSDSLLLALDDVDISPNVAQAALGSAWVRLCQGMRFDKHQFKEMCQELLEMYEPYQGVT